MVVVEVLTDGSWMMMNDDMSRKVVFVHWTIVKENLVLIVKSIVNNKGNHDLTGANGCWWWQWSHQVFPLEAPSRHVGSGPNVRASWHWGLGIAWFMACINWTPDSASGPLFCWWAFIENLKPDALSLVGTSIWILWKLVEGGHHAMMMPWWSWTSWAPWTQDLKACLWLHWFLSFPLDIYETVSSLRPHLETGLAPC